MFVTKRRRSSRRRRSGTGRGGFDGVLDPDGWRDSILLVLWRHVQQPRRSFPST